MVMQEFIVYLPQGLPKDKSSEGREDSLAEATGKVLGMG
jgi:hypothetical protein